jgi:tetratricopeptide (TPR) repeat protein
LLDAATMEEEDSRLEPVKELLKLVNEAYEKEKRSFFKNGNVPSSSLSIKELDLGKETYRPSTTRIEVFESWKGLLEAFDDEDNDLLEYTNSLRKVFRDVKNIDPANYRHLKTLIDLLTHTVVNRRRDNSTECRYVTLLEVMMSYSERWKPSDSVSQFWIRLMQRLPPDVPPVNFRRKAYRVLVSLTWVPSSKGLLGACSFDENTQNLSPEGASDGARAVLAKIRANPLPRYDCVNQLLDRLKDETDVCVAITSESEGMGKTTLAALVALHPSILRVFTIVWLSVENTKVMTYETYTKHLDNLCGQLGITPIWPESVKRFEEPALRRLREEQYMHEAKENMAELLLQKDQNILLIMDDVVDAGHIEWFRFNERQSVIVTTADPDLAGVDWTVPLDPMSEEEAIELFLNEANFPAAHVLGSTVEVRSIVQRCGCHPLTVRTVARWFQLKQVTVGVVEGMEELHQELMACTLEKTNSDDIDSDGEDKEYSTLLFDLLSLMMGPTKIEGSTSILFVICLSAMAVVFPERAPLDAVLLLWEQILRSEPYAIQELDGDGKGPQASGFIPKHAWFIAEGLTHMGVISVVEDKGSPWVSIHHKRYREFAMYMAREMDLADTFEETAAAWNKEFVSIYFDQRIQGDKDNVDDNSWKYAIEKLPAHMVSGRMFAMAETVLGEEHFFRARIEALGWNRAIDVHIEDCVRLQHALEQNTNDHGESTQSLHGISSAFGRTAEMARTQAKGALGISEASLNNEVSKALCKIGFALAENGYTKEAIAQFESAQNLLPQSQPLRASILYGLSWAYLENNESDKAMKKIQASRKTMDAIDGQHVLYREALQLYGDILIAQCEYSNAAAFFLETAQKWRGDASSCRIEFGMLLHQKGRLHHAMGELESARSTLNDCIHWKIGISECSKSLAVTYSFLGDIYMELRQLVEARDHFENSLKILGTLQYGPDSLDHLLLTGKLMFLRNEFEDSFETLGFARQIINERPLMRMDKSAYDLRCIARAFQDRGDLVYAVSVLHDSLALTSERPMSLERSSILLELGNCQFDEDEVNQCLVSLEQSLEIRIIKLGECMLVLEVLNVIGAVHISSGAYDHALEVFETVRELTEKVAGHDVERMAGVLYSIGEAYDGKANFAEAAFKFTLCVEVLKRDRSSDHPAIAKALQRLGDATVKLNDLDEAKKHYAEALRIRRLNFDETLVAETLRSLGVLRRARGDFKGAHEVLQDAFELWQKYSNKTECARTMLEIGCCYRLQEQAVDATSVYEQALEMLGETDNFRGIVYLALGHVRLSSGEDAEAVQYFERGHEVLFACYGADDIKTGNASRSLGLAKYLLNKGDEAMAHLNEFIRVCEMNGEKYITRIDYFVLAVMLLGDIYKAKADTEQANKVWSVARDICQKVKRIASEVPALAHMIDRRLVGTDISSSPNGTSIFPQLEAIRRHSEHATPYGNLSPEPEDVEVYRRILFIDD